MTPLGNTGSGLAERVVGIGSATVIMVALILLLGPMLADEPERPAHPPAEPMALPAEPIAEEAGAFRLRPGDPAVPMDAEPRPGAQRRTLATYRALRAFPGAPPRIGHALTDREFREGRCSVCHERGGYSPRFEAYVPVTPHPEYPDCLQCHVPDGDLVGLGFPDPTAEDICMQCHTLEEERVFAADVDWEPLEWPALDQRAHPEAPPRIPHRLELREACLACHGGPGAVMEMRTPHPERMNCRQCHLTAEEPADDEVFRRPSAEGQDEPGGET